MLISGRVREIALVWFTAQVIVFPLIQATRCYWRDNSIALDEYQPCFPTRANSACCGTKKKSDQINDICMSNGLCYAQVRPYTGLILQNTCTDQTWKSSDCPKICPEGKSIQTYSLSSPAARFLTPCRYAHHIRHPRPSMSKIQQSTLVLQRQRL